ncbi:HD-GYP domain-containing protein [Wukongibacter baidiensis]|uniref:HD-GYP domain-containing protein n=1 Tax=Wukongibacter baidiensis TaxID=1723361 RepID=UPI003D7FE970
MKLLQVDELQDGMLLAEDIYGRFGALYFASGAILSEKVIKGLKKLDVQYVYVVDDVDDQEEIVIVDNKLNSEYQKTVSNFKDIFFNVKVGKKLIVNEFDDSLKSLVDEITKSNNVLGRLRQIEMNDEYTYKHSINVSLIATMIGKWMGFSKNELYDLAMAGLLHDIGKSRIPNEILNKPGKLTDEEYAIMKKHADYGYDILKNTSGINENVILGALEHHERVDGKGYPLGLYGNRIHMYGKIIAVADVYDAMTSKRVYKNKICPFRVAELIFQDSFGPLDPVIANTFLKNIFQFYVGNIVKLNDNQIGTVILVNKYNPTRPLVKTPEGFIDLSQNYQYEIVDVI